MLAEQPLGPVKLIGIMSTGTSDTGYWDCGQSTGWETMYWTHVLHYLDWINQTMVRHWRHPETIQRNVESTRMK